MPEPTPSTAQLFDLTDRLEEQHLAREHGLVKTTAYVRDPSKARKKTSAADRMARMRERKKAAGLAQLDVPVELASSIKAAGGLEAWLSAQKSASAAPATPAAAAAPAQAPLPAIPANALAEIQAEGYDAWLARQVRQVEVVREVVVEKAMELSAAEKRALALGRRAQSLTGWRGRLLRWLMGE